MNWIIRLKNVRLRYGKLCALDINELQIASGERVFVLGRSGSGKTTLSQIIKGRLQ